MPDYNIYIHSDANGNSSSPTKPWTKNEGQGNGGGTSVETWTSGAEQGVNAGANPAQLVSMGTNEVKKAIPAVAAAFAIITIAKKVTDKAVSFVAETRARQIGDYSLSHAWGNLKQLYSNVTQPFQTTVNILIEEDNRRIANDRVQLQRSLLGETITNRGV